MILPPFGNEADSLSPKEEGRISALHRKCHGTNGAMHGAMSSEELREGQALSRHCRAGSRGRQSPSAETATRTSKHGAPRARPQEGRIARRTGSNTDSM